MKGYSISLKYGIAKKDFFFMTEETDPEKRWEEANNHLYEIMDGCSDSKEFFGKVPGFFGKYGFVEVKK